MTKEFAAVENGELPEKQLTRDAVGYIVAGTDTTAITATYAVWQLAHHPALQEKMIREVAALPEGFDDEDLKRVGYLDNVINETLRLHGAIQQGLPRTVPEEGAEFCGYHVPGGKTVGVQAYTLHREPAVWRSPDEFDPSRWEKPTREMLDSFWPIGGGSRICIGMHFAQLELRYALACFYRTFSTGVQHPFVDGFSEGDMLQMSYFLASPKGKRCLVSPQQ